MRKISKLIVLAMAFLFATQAFALKQKDGVYQIGSCQDLIDFAKKVNQGTSNIDAVLTQSIDMSECSEKYPMIGNEYKFLFVNHRYRGTFDGQNYVISNLAIDTVAQNVGLFGAIEGATIKNVVLQNVAIKASGNIDSPDQPVSVGGLVGWMNGGSIENCFVSGSISTNGEGNGVGSVVGYASNGSISNCMGDVKLTAYGQNVYIGGIAGYAESVTISSCVYAGKSITNGGNGTNGGIVGSTQNPASNTAYKPIFSNAYYDTDVISKGVGKSYPKAPTSGVADLNSDEVACALNGGVMEKSVCSKAGLWSNEGGRLSFNGMVTDDDGNILYLLQFNANGGKFESGARNNVFLKHGATISADGLAVPTKDGFTFVGWAFDAAADEPVESGAMPAAKTIVYAVWKKMFTVTFVANSRDAANATFADGSQMASKLVNYNGQITSEGIDQPLDYSEGDGDSKTFYTFIGWSPVNGATEAEDLGVATEEKTVFAVWKNTYVTYYTVSFDNMGHGTTPSAIRVEENNGVVAPAEPSEVGYVFEGWFASEDLSGEAYDFATPVTSNVTLYAKWSPKKYSISYMNMEDADVDDINPSEYTIESDEIVLAVPTWTGHTFGGWYSDGNFASRVTSIASGSTGDKVLFAKWSVSTYKITYAPGNYGYGIIADGVKVYDENLTLSKETFAPSDESFIQTGWALTDGGEKVYELGDVYTENKSITLFPYWVASRHNVEYIVDIKNSKGELLKTETYLTEQDIVGNTHTIAAAAVMEGYTFSGWTVVTEVADLNEGKFTMPEGDVVIKGEFTINSYMITFVGADGETLQEETLEYGVVPEYKGEAPVKAADAEFTYSFSGWDVELVAVTGEATYTAQFEAKKNQYTVTFADEDGTELSSKSYDYGTAAEDIEIPAEPSKEASAQYTYKFAGWDKGLVNVTENATYVATYESSVNSYVITFVGADGETLQEETLEYGVVPEYKGEAPVKAADAEFTYSFSGWDVELVAVTGEATYTAQFEAKKNQYTVTFADEDGTELSSKSYDYGTAAEDIEIPAEPSKDASAQYTYKFAGWDKELVNVTENATYVATYESSVNSYMITFVGADGETLQEETLEYGVVPEYKGEAPVKAADAEFTYSFSGWDVELVAVTGEATYTAQFDAEEIKKEDPVDDDESGDSSDSESGDSSSSGEEAGSSDSENGSDSDSDAITTIAMHSFGLHVSGRTLEISNAKIGANLLVVDMKGRLVRKATVNAADMRIALPQAGGYIVRVGNQVKRVVVR